METRLETTVNLPYVTASDYRLLMRRIINKYDSVVVRAYCEARFMIINLNILHMLSLALRGKRRILDIGCGFGLFGCYLSMVNSRITYHGVDLNPGRIHMATRVAERLGLKNATFSCMDARDLDMDAQYDAIMMIDLLHHLDDPAKQNLLTWCYDHLAEEGRLVVKDVTRRPWAKLAFTWALDVVMTRGFDMWYWDEARFRGVLGDYFHTVDTFPISDWLPYPHLIYLCEGRKPEQSV